VAGRVTPGVGSGTGGERRRAGHSGAEVGICAPEPYYPGPTCGDGSSGASSRVVATITALVMKGLRGANLNGSFREKRTFSRWYSSLWR